MSRSWVEVSMKKSNFPILIYQTNDGLTNVNVTFEEDTVWLTQEQTAELFQKVKSTINYHIQQVYEDGELNRDNTMRKFENFEFSTKPLNFYNLDMEIPVGYRVRSQRGVQFLLWAAGIIKKYMRKGFAMDDARLKELGGCGYFKELLACIRDIRTSEKVFYRQLLEICATSRPRKRQRRNTRNKKPAPSAM